LASGLLRKTEVHLFRVQLTRERSTEGIRRPQKVKRRIGVSLIIGWRNLAPKKTRPIMEKDWSGRLAGLKGGGEQSEKPGKGVSLKSKGSKDRETGIDTWLREPQKKTQPKELVDDVRMAKALNI